ncbi:hypothetical protein FT663_03964 [Candidozyma haemuli var. vulneris]|nr:hypothetical protein FT662_04018 [[Candida] haemuloni var. vulneris]KAF3988608.1 hypothetical protein FT663_03964 [[Candida] haemuloni var. vulneris]
MADETPASTSGSPPQTNLPNPETENDTLLSLQTAKAELVQQRDTLLAKKSDLSAAIERLQSTWDSYQTQSRQYETKKKLEYYLHQNDHEQEKRLAAEDEVASFVLDNMHVLPSSDWSKRMDLVGRFYPHVRIHHTMSKNVHNEQDQLITEIQFRLSAHGLPTLHVLLYVRDEKVVKLDILQSKKASIVLHKISPSFGQTLALNYLPQGKVDLLVYGYHSLASMQEKRVSILSNLLHQYPTNRVRPGADWDTDPFDSLSALPYIEFEFVHSKTSEPYSVRLYWHLVLNEHSMGQVDSELEFATIQKNNQTVLDGASAAFLNLVPEYGVCKSFELMVSNIF